MRGRIFAGLLAGAGALGMLATGRYMSIAPTIIARLAGVTAFLVFFVALFWALSPRLKAKWMEYVIVGAGSAAFGMAIWWGLGLIPTEAPAVFLPSLIATVQEDGGDYYLVVENKGGPAVVWSDVKITSRSLFQGGSDNRMYKGYWEGSPKAPTTELRHGQRDRLVLGGVRDAAPPVGRIGDPPISISRYLRFSFYDPNANNGRGDLEQLWARSQAPEPPKPSLWLDITLHTDPPTPPRTGVYVLTMDGLLEHQTMSPTPK
jgi:hypothetical protein